MNILILIIKLIITINIPSITEGLAISNKTMPVSRSRILKRMKSILYIFASGAHKYPAKM